MAAIYQKLSRANLKRLDSGAKITEHGISFERHAGGDGVWSVNIMVDRQRIHRVLGRESEGTTRTDCERFIEATRTAAREDRLSLPKGRKVALSFADAGKRYIEKLREEAGKCIERKERQLELHLNRFFGDRPLSKISSFEIARYRKERSDVGAKGATINRELAVVSHLFSKALEWGWITQKPKIVRFKEGQGRIIYLTEDQCDRVLNAAKNDQSPHIYLFCEIALKTSMRMSEILGMERGHVDADRRRIFIPKAKAGARDQPITTELALILAEHIKKLPKGTPWVFPSIASKTGHLATIRKAHRRVIKAAGLDPDVVVRHTFRHTAITHLVQAGVDLPTVQKISGHKTLAMVGRYSHANGAHIDAAMDKLEQRMSRKQSLHGDSPFGAITPELHEAADAA